MTAETESSAAEPVQPSDSTGHNSRRGPFAKEARGPKRHRSGIRLIDNPVLRRELIERVNGTKVVVFITIWLGLLTGILVLAYQGTVGLNDAVGLDVAAIGRVGRELFEWVLFGMLLLVLFLVPGLTAGAVTGERERQTLVPLQMTLMRPIEIILGKLAAALAFVVLLIVVAMPLLAASLLIGGVSIFDVLRGVAMLLFTALVLGSVGVFVSSRVRGTTGATVGAYAIAATFTIGSFVGLAAWAIVTQGEPPSFLLAVNPFAGVADALPRSTDGFGGFGFGDTSTPFGAMRSAIDSLSNPNNFDEGFDANGFPIFDERRGTRVSLWYLVIGSALLAVTIRQAAQGVTTPAETER